MVPGNLMTADHTRNGVAWNNFVKTKAAPQPCKAIAQRFCSISIYLLARTAQRIFVDRARPF